MNSMLEYKGYHASVKYDAEDEILVGEVFGLSDSLNFHGTSVVELKEMFKQSIDNYIALCAKIGKNPDKEFRGTFNVRIPPDLHKEVSLEAVRQSITLNQYVVNALKQSLKKEKSEETIVYMPYEFRKMNWESRSYTDFERSYADKFVWSKKESLSYAGN